MTRAGQSKRSSSSNSSPMPRIFRQSLTVIISILILLSLLYSQSASFSFNSERKKLFNQKIAAQDKGWNGVVASENAICSEIGIDVLREGGSAVDAIIAATLCIGVTNPQSSGIGGGGFLVYHSTMNQEQVSINFRETAPAASSKDMYKSNPNLAQKGPLSVGIPGELKGLEAAWHRYGHLPWKRLFQPSVDLARNGWTVNWRLASSIKAYTTDILADPALSASFAPNGVPFVEGDWITRPKLAATLETIGNEGVDVFYSGWIAKQLIKTITSMGGIMTMNDLAGYTALIQVPLLGTYRGQQVITSPPPASGAVLISILNTLENYEKEEVNLDDELFAHRLVESFKHSYAQRGYLGDPADIIYRNISEITRYFGKKETSLKSFMAINDNKTFGVDYYKPSFQIISDQGTMHISIMTAEGEAASLTSTVNLGFGSKIMDPVTGIILNDQMDDFSIPGVSNAFGLSPSPYNYIQPGKRPLSSSTPVIILRNKFPVIVAGASGGSQIITATAQSILRMIDMDQEPYSAIHSPRAHHQLLPDTIFTETSESDIIINGWKERGHNVSVGAYIFTGVSAVKRIESGLILGSGDSRKGGAARGF